MYDLYVSNIILSDLSSSSELELVSLNLFSLDKISELIFVDSISVCNLFEEESDNSLLLNFLLVLLY